MADKTYRLRVVCDETTPATDWEVFQITIKEEYIEWAEKVINFILAKLGDKIMQFRVTEYALGILEYLGFTVDD